MRRQRLLVNAKKQAKSRTDKTRLPHLQEVIRRKLAVEHPERCCTVAGRVDQ